MQENRDTKHTAAAEAEERVFFVKTEKGRLKTETFEEKKSSRAMKADTIGGS